MVFSIGIFRKRGRVLNKILRALLIVLLFSLGSIGAALIFYGISEDKNAIASNEKTETETGKNRIIYADPYYEINGEDMALLEAYKKYNPDVVGYIRIPDTILDHPLMQTKTDEEFYLNHDLDKKYNSHGIPFLSKDSEIEKKGCNMVIYGHNIHKISRDIFCDLAYYEDIEYYKAHPIIETISESGTRKWLIFAYFITDNSEEGAFRYSDYTRFLAAKDLDEFLQQVKDRNWLDVPVDIEYGDSLITLSSCSNELAGKGTNRMVVIGKLLKTDEEYTEIVEKAHKNEAPLIPEELQ